MQNTRRLETAKLPSLNTATWEVQLGSSLASVEVSLLRYTKKTYTTDGHQLTILKINSRTSSIVSTSADTLLL